VRIETPRLPELAWVGDADALLAVFNSNRDFVDASELYTGSARTSKGSGTRRPPRSRTPWSGRAGAR
jgi:hypothetical protein